MTFGYLANELFLYIILKPVTSTRHLRKSFRHFHLTSYAESSFKTIKKKTTDTVVSEDYTACKSTVCNKTAVN